MGKNIVICSDGTGNTFDKSVSSVTRLIKLLALNDFAKQVLVYDQGIGTNKERLSAVESYRELIPDKCSLHILGAGKKRGRPDPVGLPKRVLGLGFGYGIKTHLCEMYQKLSQLYEEPDDKIYFFGFSRGAFTVRALAGLIYHCGLPQRNETRFTDCFCQAYKLYSGLYKYRGDELEEIEKIVPEPKRNEEIRQWRERDAKRHEEDKVRVRDLQEKFRIHKEVKIHFLGLWDTVKSYGGVWPIVLPHLRHNPRVKTVRHALALNERRSWFDATTWGQLDLDKKGALRRLKKTLPPADLEALAKQDQDIEEVWFRGCHSDVGGGDAEAVTGMIALRWMLGEAAAKGLILNDNGKSVLSVDDPPGPPEIHESLSWPWKLMAYGHLREIDNSGCYPVLKSAWRKTGRRSPDELTRNGKISLHSSVGNLHSILVPVEHRCTRRSKAASTHCQEEHHG